MRKALMLICALTALRTASLQAGENQAAASLAELSFVESDQQSVKITGNGIAVGDFDGDGNLDAFVLNLDGYRVYFGDGRGHFTDSGQRLTTPSHVWGTPAVGDINRDGKLEVITGKTVWLNDGKGHFTAHPDLLETSEDCKLTSAALADLNCDGHLDLFAIRDYTGIRIYFNDGTGHFRDSDQRFGDVTAGKNVIAHIALGDVDGDGYIDAITAGWTEGGSSSPNHLWLNDGKGHFRDSGQILYQGKDHVHGTILGDLNGDGRLDLVLGMNSKSRSGLVLLNDGHGQFTSSQELGGTWSQGVALGDFDGDGTLDVFLVCGMLPDCPENQIWVNDGRGRFRDSGVRLPNNPIPQGAALGDFNGDGRPDVFVVSATFTQDVSGSWVPKATPARIWVNIAPKSAK